MNVIVVDGKIYGYDGQDGTRFDVIKKIKKIGFADFDAGVQLLRVDKLEFDDRFLEIFKRL